MRKELRELQRRLGITTVFVTHDQEEANTMADRMAVLNEGLLQQVGAPMALYDRPGNRFVAHFLGSANLVDGELSGPSGAPVFRADGGIELPAAEVSERRGEVTAMFRPQDVDILPADDTPTGDGRIWLLGRVTDSEFLGHMMRFTVAVGPHRLLVDDEHHLGRDHFAADSPVRLGLEPARVRFLPG
jgi:iron(III) transport system ATP-binding protein